MTDQLLLQKYAGRRDAEAFAELVVAYQRLVFATCRRTLHCADDVDDAVQETFLRLAQKAGEIRSNLGAWLHRCAVNVAVDLNREREARCRREMAVARPADATSDSQRELAELREQVDAALAKLAEGQRELIIQRFLVGRPMGEIAAELEVAGSTLTYRLSKAVEALRAELGSMGCAVSVGMITAMMEAEHAVQVPPLLTANVMKIGLKGVGAKAAVGVGILGTLWGKAAMLAAALTVAGAVWVAGAKGPSSKPVAAATTAPAGPVTFAEQAGDQNGGTPKWEAAPASAKPAVLSGRVVDDTGKPVAGAKIQLYGPGNVPPVMTDKDGRYSFATIATDGEYQLGVEAEGYVTRGPFQMRRQSEPSLQLSRTAEAKRDLVVERGVTVVISVLDGEGNSLKAVAVSTGPEAEGDGTVEQHETDGTGLATVTLPAGKPYRVIAQAEGLAPTYKSITPELGKGSMDVELVMTPGYEFRGVITCLDGKPAAGCQVYLQPKWWKSLYIPRGSKTGANGEFVVHAAADENDVYVQRERMGYRLGTVVVPLAQTPVRLSAPFASVSSLAISGRVRATGKRPSGQIEVQAIGSGNEYLVGSVDFGTDANPMEGRYEIKDVPPGEYTLRFESPEMETKTLEKVKVPGPVPLVEVQVDGRLRLRGRVVDAVTGKPLTQFAVRVMKLRTLGNGPNYVPDVNWSQVANAEGRFSVELLGPAEYQVQVSAAGYAWPWTDKIRIEFGKSAPEVLMKMTPGGALAGRVVDEMGKPVAQAKVIAYSMARSCSMGDTRKRFDGDAGAVVTDEQGRFVQPHLPAGGEMLKVVHPDFAPQIVEGLKVTDGVSTDVGSIAIKAGGTVEGTVYDRNGQPEEGVLLRFQDETAYNGGEEVGRLASATTDAEGHFRVTHLPERKTYVWAGDPWKREGMARQLVRPISGKTTKLDFGGATVVSGRLLDGSIPAANREVLLTTDDAHFGPVLVRGTTDSKGRFAFRGVPAGQYLLYQMSDPKRHDFAVVREVAVNGNGTELDDPEANLGTVEFSVEAEDTADLARISGVSLLWGDAHEHIATKKVGEVWRAEGVRAGRGRIRVSLHGEEGSSMVAEVPIERKEGEKMLRKSVRLAKQTAFLTVPASPVNAGDWTSQGLRVATEDRSIGGFVRRDANKTMSLRLPPGTYYVMPPAGDKPMDGVPPIKLTAGETTAAQAPETWLRPANPVVISVTLWTADGHLVTSTRPRLYGEDGAEIERDGRFRTWGVWRVKPGRYQAIADAGDGKRVTKDVNVTPDLVKADRPAVEVDLFMP